MKKILALLLIALCLGLCAAASADELKAPTDFAFDTESGKLSFVSNDENAGYYFVRIYPVVSGTEANAYVSSSKRINAGKVGEKSGKVDVSAIGWGLYNGHLHGLRHRLYRACTHHSESFLRCRRHPGTPRNAGGG